MLLYYTYLLNQGKINIYITSHILSSLMDIR